ncbi:MAG: chorismate-binding protein, partial [Erysipelotrichaceae bacterium]
VNFKQVEKFSNLMHLVSNVKGLLRDDLTCIDALLSMLPAGTLSGAPKIRAMQIIDELEVNKRGLYGGCIGYLDNDGSMDSCIAIRTVLYKNGVAYIQSGAGIVADSIAINEYEETIRKADSILNVMRKVGTNNDNNN